MESDRKLRLAELRQKRLAYYQKTVPKCQQQYEEIDVEKPEYAGRPTNITEEKLTNKHKQVRNPSMLSPSHRSPDTNFVHENHDDEQPKNQPRNLSHSLNFDPEELINRCFDAPHRITRSEDYATSRCDESYVDDRWSREGQLVHNPIHDVTNTDDTSVDSLHQKYLAVNNSLSECRIQTKKQDNIKSKKMPDCNLSPRPITRTRKQKTREKHKKYQRNPNVKSEETKQGVEKKPSPRLPENFFDLDSLQKAARNGDDVLRKYIKDLSTKMVDSQTEIKVATTERLDYDFPPSEQDTHSNLFLSRRDKLNREDSSDSLPDEGNNFFLRTERLFDSDNPHETSEQIENQFNTHFARSSLQFEDKKTKYVPKISRPAIESSQLKKWGLYDDLENNLSLLGSTVEDEYPIFGSKDQNENDFDLLTHRPSNRPFSPLIQSNRGIYETPEINTDSQMYDAFNLTTHRPRNTENKLFHRVNGFYDNESPGRSSKSDHHCINDDVQEDLLKTYNDNTRSTSPEQHILGVRKYHKIEKQRRKSKNQKIGDFIECSSPTINEELATRNVETRNNGYSNNQEPESSRSSGAWDFEDDFVIDTKHQIDVMSSNRDRDTEVHTLSMSPTPTTEDTPLMLEPKLKLNDMDSDDIKDNFLRNQKYISDDTFVPDQEETKHNLHSSVSVSQGKTFSFYDKQFNSIPLSRSPEPRLQADLSPEASKVPILDLKFEDVSLGDNGANDWQDDFSINFSSKADLENRKSLGFKLNLSFNSDDEDDRQIETYRVKTPFLKKILENESKVESNLEVVEDKKMRSNSPMNSRKKTGNRLLDRGQSQKQKWLTSSSLPSSVLATRKSTQLSSSLKDSKRNSIGTSLRLSGKDVGTPKQVSRSQGKLRERCSPVERLKKKEKKVINGKFFTVTPASKTTEFNSPTSHFQQEYIPPLTLQLLSDSPRGGEGLSIWQLLPDEVLFHIFSYLSHMGLAVTAQVCQTFHRIANDELLWKIITLQKKELTDDWLFQIGEKHPTDISLLQCNGAKVSEDGLRAMFRACTKSLKKLNVGGSTGGDLIGDSILLHASRCLRLASLDVSWCSVTNNGLTSVAESIEMLQVLCLNGCQAITDDSINMILQKHCKSIVVLELFGCFNISPSLMSQIGKLCRNLHTLNVGQCYKMMDDDMTSMVSHLERVQHLDMRGCKQMHDTTVRKLVRCCKKLKSISLANCCHLTDASLVEISTYLPTIRMIDVSGCKKITNQGVHSLAKSCYQLSSLDLSSTSVNHKSVSSLSSYCGKSLKTFKLNFCKDMTEKSVLKLLQHCQRLEMLQLYGVKGLRNLTSIKNQFAALKID